MPLKLQASAVINTQGSATGQPQAPERSRRTQAIGACLGGLLAPQLARQGVLLAQILPYWPSICPLLATYAVPESIRGSTLTIAASTSSAQRELQFLAPSIIEGVNTVLGYQAIDHIRSAVRGEQAMRAGGAQKGNRKGKPSGALQASAAELDKAHSLSKHVPEQSLQTALRDFAVAVIRTREKL